MGGVGYYRKFLPKMAAVTKTLNSLLNRGVTFEFTAEHTQTVQALLAQLASPQVLAFPDFAAAISGNQPFQLVRRVRGWVGFGDRTRTEWWYDSPD